MKGQTVRELPATIEAMYEHRVSAGDTARHWGNDLPVLATPVLLWLGEVTAMRALADYLNDGEMTVGLAHDSAHLAPTPAGQLVKITARLRERTGRTLVFDVEGRDDHEIILRGTHTRAVVNRTRFLARLANKQRVST
jgi:fluoroacetyl-CoA thioesterase